MSQTDFKPLKVIGLMSGTSADGIDAALLETDGITVSAFGPTHYEPYDKGLRDAILRAYGIHHHDLDLERVITDSHGKVVSTLLHKAGLKPVDVDLIGFHGQTLFHQPPQSKGETGKTCILSDGPLLASLTGIPVIDQLRLNDIAHGGQGAPLVPVFHKALATSLDKPVAILNMGGVANVTWIHSHDADLMGFDIGPGNGLIDDWIRMMTGFPYDEGGKIAEQGKVNDTLINRWLDHPYFLRKPPKSLDRLTFKSCIDDIKTFSLEDGAATLTAFTAASIAQALSHFPEKPIDWFVVGGGAHNHFLLSLLNTYLNAQVKKGSDGGWNSDALEAQAFAYIAARSLRQLPYTFPGTTGVPFPLSGGRFCKV